MTRIVEALEARQDWDVARTLALQADRLSIPWREMCESLLSAPATCAETQEALGLLSAWDGLVSVGFPAAMVFKFFLVDMSQRIARAKAPRTADWALGRGSLLEIVRHQKNPPGIRALRARGRRET